MIFLLRSLIFYSSLNLDSEFNLIRFNICDIFFQRLYNNNNNISFLLHLDVLLFYLNLLFFLFFRKWLFCFDISTEYLDIINLVYDASLRNVFQNIITHSIYYKAVFAFEFITKTDLLSIRGYVHEKEFCILVNFRNIIFNH